MATSEEAQRAISELNGKDLDGRKITVNVSNPRTPGSGGGRGPGGPRRWRRTWGRRRSRRLRRAALQEALPLVARETRSEAPKGAVSDHRALGLFGRGSLRGSCRSGRGRGPRP
jgi:RNA recognition motif-containing protein